jgi:hypothetical protein
MDVRCVLARAASINDGEAIVAGQIHDDDPIP